MALTEGTLLGVFILIEFLYYQLRKRLPRLASLNNAARNQISWISSSPVYQCSWNIYQARMQQRWYHNCVLLVFPPAPLDVLLSTPETGIFAHVFWSQTLRSWWEAPYKPLGEILERRSGLTVCVTSIDFHRSTSQILIRFPEATNMRLSSGENDGIMWQSSEITNDTEGWGMLGECLSRLFING